MNHEPTLTLSRRAKILGRSTLASTFGIGAGIGLFPSTASAQLTGEPSAAGLPGGNLLQQLLNWGLYIGLAMCALALMYGGVNWAFAHSNGQVHGAHKGQKTVIGALLGAAIVGGAVVLANMLFQIGQTAG